MTAVLAAPTEPVRERRQVALGQYDPYDNTPYDKKPNKKPNQYGDQQNDNQYGQENNGYENGYQQPQQQQQQVPSWVNPNKQPQQGSYVNPQQVNNFPTNFSRLFSHS